MRPSKINTSWHDHQHSRRAEQLAAPRAVLGILAAGTQTPTDKAAHADFARRRAILMWKAYERPATEQYQRFVACTVGSTARRA